MPRRLVRINAWLRETATITDHERLLARLADGARELTQARYGALGLFNAAGRELARFVTSGIDPVTEAAIGAPPRGRGVLGELFFRDTPLRLADIGAHPHSYGFPPGHPPMRTFLGVPLLRAGRTVGALYVADRLDGEFTDDDELVLGLLAAHAASLLPLTETVAELDKRAAALGRAAAVSESVLDLMVTVTGELDVDRVLELIVKRSRALIGARTMLVTLLDGERGLALRAAAGELAHAAAAALRAIEHTVREVTVEGVERAVDIPPGALSPASAAEATVPALVMPLAHRGTPLGALIALGREENGRFGPQDIQMLRATATGPAAALGASLRHASETRRQAADAAEAERARWARELHDAVLQDLAGLTLVLGELEHDLPDERHGLLRHAMASAEAAIASVRALVADLRPIALDELGLEGALEELVRRYRALPGAPTIELDADLAYERGRTDERHRAELESAMYRIVQEALANAVRHGDAGEIAIRLLEADAEVRLEVTDDGRGFDTQRPSTGLGHVSIRERAALVGGAAEIRSAPGEGTSVRALLPVGRRAASGRRGGRAASVDITGSDSWVSR